MTQELTIRLDYHERSFLVMVADRGGSIPFNWEAVGFGHQHQDVIRRRVRDRVDSLIGKGTLTEVALLGAPGRTVTLTLTQVGRNLVDLVRRGTPNAPR